MNLCLQSWSVNQYCLSKVWFRTHSVDLRVMDINSITSSVKSWLYADQLLKPDEKVLFRPSSHGGLGLHNVKWKALAGLVRTFLETACNPKFQTSLYHSLLFRYHVLDDHSVPDPGFPPFYNAEFFTIIKSVHADNSKDVALMTEKEWYTRLVQDQCIMENDGGGLRRYIPCNAQMRSPHANWEECWRGARLSGLGPENSSFLFKLLHGTLVTQERLSRTNPTVGPNCKTAGCPGHMPEDIEHALVTCPGNNGVGASVLRSLTNFVPDLEARDALLLDFNVDERIELPLVWAMAVAWGAIWDMRQSKTRPQLYLVRAQMEAKVALLRECRKFANAAAMIETIINTI